MGTASSLSKSKPAKSHNSLCSCAVTSYLTAQFITSPTSNCSGLAFLCAVTWYVIYISSHAKRPIIEPHRLNGMGISERLTRNLLFTTCYIYDLGTCRSFFRQSRPLITSRKAGLVIVTGGRSILTSNILYFDVYCLSERIPVHVHTNCLTSGVVIDCARGHERPAARRVCDMPCVNCLRDLCHPPAGTQTGPTSAPSPTLRRFKCTLHSRTPFFVH